MIDSVPYGEALSSGPAVEYIREKILDGTFPPGSFLSGKALAKTLGMSRTPIRDALRMLETQGLVQFTPHLGAVVTKLSDEELSDLTGLRRIMEAYCAALAAQRRTIAELRKLEETVQAMEALAPGSPSAPEWLQQMARHDSTFHWTVIRATKNPFLIKEIEQSRALLTVHSRAAAVAPPSPSDLVGLHASVCRKHREIYEAIRQQDALAARRTMEEHLSVGSPIPVP